MPSRPGLVRFVLPLCWLILCRLRPFAELLAGQQSHRVSGRHVFSKDAPVTFGGLRRVCPYVAREAVQTPSLASERVRCWMELGLAETTGRSLSLVTTVRLLSRRLEPSGRCLPLLPPRLAP